MSLSKLMPEWLGLCPGAALCLRFVALFACCTALLSTGSSVALAQSAMGCSAPSLAFGGGAGQPMSVSDSIIVTTSFVIQDANVSVDIVHAFIGDITLDLQAPSATSVRLHDEGGLTGTQILLTFDDQGIINGSDLYECDCAMQPSGPGELFDLQGLDSAGEWVITATDVFPASDDGTLVEWCVELSDSVPPSPVATLICVATPMQGRADISWSNSSTYDSIDVRVAGVLVATLPGNANSTVVETDFPGVAEVCVVGNVGATATNPTCCLVEFTDAPALQVCNGGPQPIVDTVLLQDEIVVAAPGMVQFLEVSVDITHAFVGDLEIDLRSPLDTAVALNFQGGFGETQINLTYNDQGFFNGPPYDCSCLKQPVGPGVLADIVGEPMAGGWSIEVLDVFVGDQGTLNQWCVRFHEPGSGQQFIRGDVNGDGSFAGLVDGLFALNYQFVPGSAVPPCLEAADADNSGVFVGLLDGLYVLNAQFVAGAPAPPLPYPGCGPDDDNALGCDGSVCP